MSKRIAVALLIAVALGVAYASGALDGIEASTLRDALRETGAWAPVVFVLLFACLEAIGVPASIFLLTAVALWPPWQAFLLNWAGAVGAGLVGFALARRLGREWVADRLPERVRGLDQRLGERGVAGVIFVRLMFFVFAPSHWALGLSRISVPAAVVGTVVGLAPGIALYTFAGVFLLDWLAERPPAIWLWLGLGIAAAFVGVGWLHRRRTAPRSGPA